MAETNFYIYSITNTLDGKKYIGSTTSTTNRWKKHRWQLNRGIHANCHLQRAWNKYKKESFVFEIIDVKFGTTEEKKKTEDLYIEKFNTLDENFGYNMNSANLIAGNLKDETKRKISKSLINNPKICKKIVQYDIFTGNFIKEWPSSMEIKRSLGGSNGGYLKCCKHNSSFQSVKGFGWAFFDEYFSKNEIEWAKPDYISHFKVMGNKRSILGRHLITGREIKFDTITNGSKFFGCTPRVLQRAVQFQGTRGRKSYKGYSWEYSDIGE